MYVQELALNQNEWKGRALVPSHFSFHLTSHTPFLQF